MEHGGAAAVVVRLKGGDPFLFGRGGEEAEVLTAAGVAWEVVPGVTSAFGVPAVAGIPVTQRGLASSVTVVTGRVGDAAGRAPMTADRIGRRWPEPAGRLVILMGMTTRAAIADALDTRRPCARDAGGGDRPWDDAGSERSSARPWPAWARSIWAPRRHRGRAGGGARRLGRAGGAPGSPLAGRTVVVTRSRAAAARVSSRRSSGPARAWWSWR